ncbi:MAG TPA: hypothetical protein VEM96_04280 [Pyrinomonadaceae bacterium]|nr:hypothetical protein [Pyrinomonadaceae bacterium]
MKLTTLGLLSLVIFLLVIPTALAGKPEVQPTATVAGVYENFTLGKGSGDLEGMRVVIVPAGVGYYAIVQIAQGGAEDPKPEFVEAKVKGMTVAFSVGDEKFTGTATATGLRLKNSAGESQVLKRKSCSSYFR